MSILLQSFAFIKPAPGRRVFLRPISLNVFALTTPFELDLRELLPGGACHPARRCRPVRMSDLLKPTRRPQRLCECFVN